MKLDRNNPTGHGKYGLIHSRRLDQIDGQTGPQRDEVRAAIATLQHHGVIDWGLSGTPSEFFVIRLRDIHAPAALQAYADHAVQHGDTEFAGEVRQLAIAATQSKHRKLPD